MPCHNSRYNPRDAAAVVDGPSPRALSALPLEIVDGKLVVAKPFIGRPRRHTGLTAQANVLEYKRTR